MKNPEVIPTTMPHQGVSTKMYRENSLTRLGKLNILGVPRLRATHLSFRKQSHGAALGMTVL